MSNTHGYKWIRVEKRLAIYSRDGFACVYCGSEERLTLDHLQPRELGGSHHATNLVTACLACNAARHDMSLRQWFAVLRDRGIATDRLSKQIKRHTARALDIDEGKRLLAARRAVELAPEGSDPATMQSASFAPAYQLEI